MNIYEHLRNLDGLEDYTDKELKDILLQDYDDLIDLRNRIKNETDDETRLYEEDHITLDHVLDYMELFMKIMEN
jgi:hypothetical protein